MSVGASGASVCIKQEKWGAHEPIEILTPSGTEPGHCDLAALHTGVFPPVTAGHT